MIKDEIRCEVGGVSYDAISVMNESCTGCAGDGHPEICGGLGLCRAEDRQSGRPVIWRKVATLEEFKLKYKARIESVSSRVRGQDAKPVMPSTAGRTRAISQNKERCPQSQDRLHRWKTTVETAGRRITVKENLSHILHAHEACTARGLKDGDGQTTSREESK